jgi:8-oxo-dGTP diphosphatase
MTRADTEELAFLASYDASRYPRPSVTVDVVLLTVAGGALRALLGRRTEPPAKGRWALPGGFVAIDEGLDEAASRVLRDKARLHDVFVEQLFTFGSPDRDPRTRVISVAYYALLPGPDSAFHPTAGTDAAEARWWPVDEVPALAFDHDQIVGLALSRLRAKLGYTSVAYALLSEEFTLTELQTVYEIILGQGLDKRNFRKKMLSIGILEATPRQKRAGAHRPAQLYRFTKREPVFLG